MVLCSYLEDDHLILRGGGGLQILSWQIAYFQHKLGRKIYFQVYQGHKIYFYPQKIVKQKRK